MSEKLKALALVTAFPCIPALVVYGIMRSATESMFAGIAGALTFAVIMFVLWAILRGIS